MMESYTVNAVIQCLCNYFSHRCVSIVIMGKRPILMYERLLLFGYGARGLLIISQWEIDEINCSLKYLQKPSQLVAAWYVYAAGSLQN